MILCHELGILSRSLQHNTFVVYSKCSPNIFRSIDRFMIPQILSSSKPEVLYGSLFSVSTLNLNFRNMVPSLQQSIVILHGFLGLGPRGPIGRNMVAMLRHSTAEYTSFRQLLSDTTSFHCHGYLCGVAPRLLSDLQFSLADNSLCDRMEMTKSIICRSISTD